ncbi:unnamed protein product [Pedinophyceae sp. YPF-701]|nr:unnamed protein product [Pedinophyceae sp. YPF-701]
MANRTDKEAADIKGTNPQNLVEYIVRQKVYDTRYWKENCFGVSAEGVVDLAVDLRCVGGTFGGTRKPTEFLCLILKMLQIQPDREIITEFIRNEDHKYIRLLGAFYLRLVGRAKEIYEYLEPLYNDYRKVRFRALDGTYRLEHVDSLVDKMLSDNFLFDIALPRIPARDHLVEQGVLAPRVSVLQEDFDEQRVQEEAERAEREAAELEGQMRAVEEARGQSRSPPPGEPEDVRRRSRTRSRSRSPRRRRSRERGGSGERWRRTRSPEGRRRRSRERGGSRERRSERDEGRRRERDGRYDRREDVRDRRGGRVDDVRDRDGRRSDRRGERYDRYDRYERHDDRYDERRRRGDERERHRERERYREGGSERGVRRGVEEVEEGEIGGGSPRGARGEAERGRGEERERREKKEKKEKKKKEKADSEVDVEIAEANALRAKLGLKPLR